MALNPVSDYPTSLDSFPNPTGKNMDDVGYEHDSLHELANDAIEALQAKVGIDSSAVTSSHDYKLSGVTGSDKAVSLTGTETLTNKRLTSPKINEDVAVTSTATELNKVDGVTDGTVSASKAVIADSNKDVDFDTGDVSATNITSTGTTTPAILALPNTTPTADGRMGFDTANEDLAVGDGTNSQKVHMGAWKTWTPTWTNLTVGNGTLVAKYTQIGKTVIGQVRFSLGSTSAISGNVDFTLPVTAKSESIGDDRQVIGNLHILDTGTVTFPGTVRRTSTTKGNLLFGSPTGGGIVAIGQFSGSSPMTWATGDGFFVEFTYEAA